MNLTRLLEIKKALRKLHRKGGLHTNMGCVCGAGQDGPHGTPACHAYSDLMEELKQFRLALEDIAKTGNDRAQKILEWAKVFD